jgi:uncharacterized protein
MEPDVYVEELSEEVCRFLLTDEEVGRLAYLGADGYPVVLPMNYVIDGDCILMRTAPGAKLEEVPLHRVAFEVDHLAPMYRLGWSVLVQGRARELTSADGPAYTALRERRVDPWVPGDKDRWLSIEIARLTGRRIVAATQV